MAPVFKPIDITVLRDISIERLQESRFFLSERVLWICPHEHAPFAYGQHLSSHLLTALSCFNPTDSSK